MKAFSRMPQEGAGQLELVDEDEIDFELVCDEVDATTAAREPKGSEAKGPGVVGSGSGAHCQQGGPGGAPKQDASRGGPHPRSGGGPQHIMREAGPHQGYKAAQQHNFRPVSVQYDALTATEMARLSTVAVNTEILYNEHRQRQDYGPLDLRFGPSERGILCKECGLQIMEYPNGCPGCPGHFGHVPMSLPVFHPGFLRHLYLLAQCLCKACGRMLLPEQESVILEDVAPETPASSGDIDAVPGQVSSGGLQLQASTLSQAAATTSRPVKMSRAATSR
ncbi:unnamed protein product, partial [Amoebophrya sp. A25]|eukprot:GSA25T00023227001.1